MGKKIKKKNGIDEVLLYSLQGCIRIRNQKYILEDGSRTDYLRLCNSDCFHHYSAGLCNLIEEWSEDLSYEKVSQLLLQVTGNEALSSSGVQSYLACKAESISNGWVSQSNTTIKEIEVISDILIYESQEAEIILMMDDVGVKAQKPHKKVARQAEDAKRLDTTVILVQATDKTYHYATKGIDKTGKTIYSVEQAIIDKVSQLHDLSKPIPIVAVTDGARSIRLVLQAIFGISVCIILDWYHLQLKVKNLMSMIAYNKADKEVYMNDLKEFLWFGNATEAIIYLDNMDKVKNEVKHKELRDYLEKHQKEIINYDLRQSVHKTIGSGRCEKANDVVVAHRQKKKGMAWSRVGSSALAIIKTNRINLNRAA